MNRQAGICVAICVLSLRAMPGAAQGYRALVELRGQNVALRGWALDSVPAGSVSTVGAGSFVSSDGFAVDCRGAAFCYFYRPGDRQNALPLAASADVAIW